MIAPGARVPNAREVNNLTARTAWLIVRYQAPVGSPRRRAVDKSLSGDLLVLQEGHYFITPWALSIRQRQSEGGAA